MNDPIRNLQEDVAARLNSVEFFTDVPVFVVREQEIEAELNRSLGIITGKAGKIGAAVSVLMPLFDAPNPDVPGPQGAMSITIRCQENPLFNNGENGTGKSAELIALKSLTALHHFMIQGVAGTLHAARDAITPAPEYLPLITYDVRVEAKLAILIEARVALPAFDYASGNVTLTVPVGASAYYTLDGSFPSPNASSYVAPFPAEPGAVVRWAAYQSGLLPSDVGHAQT